MNDLLKAAGAIAVGTYSLKRLLGSKDHDDYVADAFDSVQAATSDDAKLYVDHIDRDGVDSPHSGHGGDHVPDIVSIDGPTSNAIVEVETADSIRQSQSHIVDQLVDFGEDGNGKRLILAVPELNDDQEVWNAAVKVGSTAEERMDSDHEIKVTTPAYVGEAL